MDDVALLVLAAIEIAAPLLAALFLADFALGLLSRAAPEMHVFVLGLPVKILLTLTLTGLALPLLPGAVSTLTDRIVHDRSEEHTSELQSLMRISYDVFYL